MNVDRVAKSFLLVLAVIVASVVLAAFVVPGLWLFVPVAVLSWPAFKKRPRRLSLDEELAELLSGGDR